MLIDTAFKKDACFLLSINMFIQSDIFHFFFTEMIADIALKKGETSLSELSRNLSKAVDPLSFAAGFYQE